MLHTAVRAVFLYLRAFNISSCDIVPYRYVSRQFIAATRTLSERSDELSLHSVVKFTRFPCFWARRLPIDADLVVARDT